MPVFICGTNWSNLKQRYLERIRYINTITHNLYVFYTLYRIYMNTGHFKILWHIYKTPIKAYTWTPWNNSIFGYTTIKTNSYPNSTLEIATLYSTLSVAFKWNTPPHDVIYSYFKLTHPVRFSTVLSART